IPSALIKPVYEQAKAVAVGNASTLVTKRDKMIKRLNAMQVDTPRILARLGRVSVEDIGLEDLEVLIGAGTAIRDGDTSVDEAFPPVGKQPSTESNEDRLKRQTDEQGREAEKSAQTLQPDPRQEDAPTGAPSAAEEGWPDRVSMMEAFTKLAEVLGQDAALSLLSTNGISSQDDMGINDPATLAAYKAMQAAAHAKQAAEKATPINKAPVFGRRNR
ncbi:MAG: hypothetical protein ACLGXA_02355, partial [Acidobacteriota bacterium]